MYTKFFGLSKRPFVLAADPEFFFLSRGHDLALTHLEYGLMHNVGIVTLTGEIGAGKTTLVKYLVGRIQPSLDIGMVLNTHLSPLELLEVLAREFELKPASPGKNDLFYALANHFMKQYGLGRRCLILVDEAQNLPQETFEELRMLSNLEVENDFLLQIILVGQPQLRTRLSHPALKQLAQRISVAYHLSPLSLPEVGSYVAHRLSVAGYGRAEPLFSEEALERVAEVSGGIPRVVNSVCDAALTYAFAEGMTQVSGETVDKVVQDHPFLSVQAPETLAPSATGSGRGSGDGRPGGYSGGGSGRHGDAPNDGYGGELAPPPGTAGCDGTGPLGGDRALLAGILGRMADLETRLGALENEEHQRVTDVLQDMLIKERERNSRLERKVASLLQKVRELKQGEAESAPRTNTVVKHQPRLDEGQKPLSSKARGIWRILGGGDD